MPDDMRGRSLDLLLMEFMDEILFISDYFFHFIYLVAWFEVVGSDPTLPDVGC